jgi:hypothetical protein
MFVFKKYDRQNHVWRFMTKYLWFLCKFTSWSCGCIEKRIQCWKNCWYSYNIDKCKFLDTATRLQWPVTQISTSQQFFLLIRLFKYMNLFHNHFCRFTFCFYRLWQNKWIGGKGSSLIRHIYKRFIFQNWRTTKLS